MTVSFGSSSILAIIARGRRFCKLLRKCFDNLYPVYNQRLLRCLPTP